MGRMRQCTKNLPFSAKPRTPTRPCLLSRLVSPEDWKKENSSSPTMSVEHEVPLPIPNQTPPKAQRGNWPYRPECIQVPRSRYPKDAHHRMKIESPLLDWFRDLFGWSSPRRSSVLVAIEERSSRSRYPGLVSVCVERDREVQDLPSLM